MSIKIKEELIGMNPTIIETENGYKTNIKIERTRVGLKCKLLSLLVSTSSVWRVLLVYATILGIISLAIVLYMKSIGELLPFCLYDNWFYLAYYCFLTIFCALLLPITDFSLFHYESQVWKWLRRIGAALWYIEIQGLAYFVVFYKAIEYELEYDDEAQLRVWSLCALSVLRFVTISIGYWVANNTLNRVISTHKLAKNYFGNTFTDFTDLFVSQFIVTSVYLYSYSLCSICFAVSLLYFYVYFART